MRIKMYFYVTKIRLSHEKTTNGYKQGFNKFC